MSFYNRVKKDINKFISSGDTIIIGVSGGPDSMALLYFLNSIKTEFDLKLFSAHFNHKLRGKASMRDLEFVRKISSAMGIPFLHAEGNIREKSSTSGFGVEKTAREARYKFLINCAAKVNAGKIALAHNLDDNAETVISRFISGSGTTGMSGIPPVREIQPGEFNTVVLFKNGAQPVIIRPLIGETKKQILSYDKANSVKYVIDATNRSNIYTRNSIRNRLIPFIEKNYSPNFKEAAVQSAEIASVENEFMRSEAKKQLRHTVKQISDKRCVVDVGKYLRLHKALRCRVLRMILENITGHKRKITYSLVSDVDKAVIAGKKMDLPYGFCIKSGVFEKKAVLKKNIDRGRAEISSLKDLPQQVEYNGKLFKFSSCAKTAGLMLKTGNTVYMDLDRVSFPIYIRQRKQGDRFIPFGMQKQVKLKDFIISQKIKETLTVVSDRSHIIWAAGHRIDDSVKVNEDSKKLLRIEINSI